MIFWTKFAQKVCFPPKTEKVNTTIEFYIFKLVKVPNFSLNWQFWFFGPNLPKKGVSGLKGKKWTPPLDSAYSNSRYQISAEIDNFNFLGQICPKNVFSVWNRKSEHHHWILHIRISLGTKFQLKLTILIFFFVCLFVFYQICPKIEFPVKNRKIAYGRWSLLTIPWSLLTILNFSARGPTDTTVF